MCAPSSFPGMMKTLMVMGAIQAVLGVIMLICGAVAASYSVPECPSTDLHCEDSRDDVNKLFD
eukprot:CAMPEP_0181336748 /NCGR_PEP_ID=MMETSP1101-20121128/27600_1 /TAXON_ID=46948 /ORGANISM="Rhodomonas abbreviata, Strain Caron Lab Isolate" /LENGTH=62 /DNA_ID=CAMNT_0023447095 /DNA_START=106 /DNA_END=291 /DNA_ORIENTATION=+